MASQRFQPVDMSKADCTADIAFKHLLLGLGEHQYNVVGKHQFNWAWQFCTLRPWEADCRSLGQGLGFRGSP